MKALRFILFIAIIIILFWVLIPVEIPLKFNIGTYSVDTTLRTKEIYIQNENFQYYRSFATRLGLDLRGGSRLTFEADVSDISSADIDDAVISARNIIEQRVNMFGLSEPAVQTIKSGDSHRITVDLPGVEDVADAVSVIGQTAKMTFREASDSAAIATDTPLFLALTEPTGLEGKHVKKAEVVFDPQTSEPQVALRFDNEGKEIFAEVTKRNIGSPVGIYLDEYLISAPTVQTEILDGNAVINGMGTVDNAKQLAISINSGALPIPITLIEQRNIGPSLGQQEIQRSLFAGIVGLTLVILFMLLTYGKFGMVAAFSLILYGIITLAIFNIIPVVLTLPGITGFILSIGMAVDGNVLIFERINEEIRRGRSMQSAIRMGFKRAFVAIKSANTTTLLVTFILFNPFNWEFLPQFGFIRGFAITLAIGVMVSLFTGVFVTKKLLLMFFK